MSTASLDNPRARVRRAYEHLYALQQAFFAFTDGEPYTIERQPQPEPGVEIAVFRMREQPPLELGVIAGDFFHNLRAALENLAWQLVLLDGSTPDQNTSFPVASNRQRFKSQAGSKLRGVKPSHVGAIEALQPYPTRKDAASRAVDAVHDFARIDRHQVVHPAFAVLDPDPRAISVQREPITAEFNVAFEYLTAGKPLEDGAPLARMRATSHTPQKSKVKMEVEFPIRMAFGERGLSTEAFPAIWRQIDLIVESFADDFRDAVG